MMRSMSSAVSALRNHQTRMDVVGNNIANVNTVGYKTSRVIFKDSLNQMVRGAAGATDARGGTNPHQIGMGMSISSIDTIFGQGVPDFTGKLSDVMIEGEGFFMVSTDGDPNSKMYTRAGNFDIDTFGNLVNADGLRVLGYQADQEGNVGTALGKITIPVADTFPPKVTTEVTMEGNLDARVKELPAGAALVGAAPTAATDIDNTVYIAKFKNGSNANDGFIYTLNPKHVKSVARETDTYVYDSLGERHNIKLAYVRTAPNTYQVLAFGFAKNGAMYPAGGTAPNFTLQAENPISNPPAGTGNVGVLEFTGDGKLNTTAGGPSTAMNISFTLTSENGANPVVFRIDNTALTQYGVESTAVMSKQDGYTVGKLTGFEISTDGMVNGIFSNGQSKRFGQIATAVFSNPPGLVKKGGSLFAESNNSGVPQINKPGAGANGLLKPGNLEMSGVDLGVEFTNMITTQRGFQANSRTISTTDQMLEELVNLKR